MSRSVRERNSASAATRNAHRNAARLTRRLRLEGLEVREMLTGVAGAFSSAAASMRLFSASSLTTNTRPAAPSLVATAVSASQINLSWNAVSGASGYLVEELTKGGWSQIGNAYSGVRVYTVGGLSAGTTYSFEVGAYNLAGVSWSRFQTATTAAAAAVTAGEPAAATAYTPVSGALFAANGPYYLDVHQGNLGDCWLMASLAEVAARDPADIVSMFTPEGTTVENGAGVGLYRVRFFNSNGVAEYVTVDTELPSAGAYYDQVQNGVLWAALAEKAYAEANGAGIVTSGDIGSDSYAALNGGNPCWALQAITGKAASAVSNNPSSVAAAWNAGQFVVLCTSPGANDNLIVGDASGTHAYAVVNYVPSSGNPFELYNPWGISSVVGALVPYNGHEVYAGPFYTSATVISNDFVAQCVGSGALAGPGSLDNGSPQVAAGVDGNPVSTPTDLQAADPSVAAPASVPAIGAYPHLTRAVDNVLATWGDAAHVPFSDLPGSPPPPFPSDGLGSI